MVEMIQRVRRNGTGTVVVTIPKKTRENYKIKVGDVLKIEIKQIMRQEEQS